MSEPVVMRVGDRERQQVDDLLRAALADGVLTLIEYEDRAGRCWGARTRPELDEVVRDLPGARPPQPTTAEPTSTHTVLAVMSECGLEAPLLPGQEVRATAVRGTAEVRPAAAGGAVVHVVAHAVMGTVEVDDRARKGGLLAAFRTPDARAQTELQPAGHQRRHRAGGLSWLAGTVLPLAVSGALAFGLLQVITADDGAAVFGSREVPLSRDAEVGMLFGSVTVVVSDDVRVRPSGITVFGSVDCRDACTGNGREVVVRGTGAFGSLEVLTEQEARRAAAEDAAEDVEDDD